MNRLSKANIEIRRGFCIIAIFIWCIASTYVVGMDVDVGMKAGYIGVFTMTFFMFVFAITVDTAKK